MGACVSSAAKEFPAIETVLAARQRRALLQNAASGATTEARSPPHSQQKPEPDAFEPAELTDIEPSGVDG